jgi:hypothetical protein
MSTVRQIDARAKASIEKKASYRVKAFKFNLIF